MTRAAIAVLNRGMKLCAIFPEYHMVRAMVISLTTNRESMSSMMPLLVLFIPPVPFFGRGWGNKGSDSPRSMWGGSITGV